MKKLIFSTIALIGLISCEKKPIVVDTSAVTKDPDETVIENCYIGILKKDTVSMKLDLKGSKVSGDLIYNHFEKDKNTGKLEGVMKGDTLIANYIFMSEGISSIRQVVFLRNGNTLTEGYGAVANTNDGKVVFKDLSNVKFDTKTVLSKVDCKK